MQSLTIQDASKLIPKYNVILLTGKAGCGKDYLGNYLSSNFGYNKIAIADKLKEQASSLLDIPLEKFYRDKDKSLNFYGKITTPRELLQQLADIIQPINPHKWVSLLDVFFESSKKDRIVLTDLRFKHEYDWLSIYNPKIIYIESTKSYQYSYLSHHSEKNYDYFKSISDEQLVNDGTENFISEIKNKLLTINE